MTSRDLAEICQKCAFGCGVRAAAGVRRLKSHLRPIRLPGKPLRRRTEFLMGDVSLVHAMESSGYPSIQVGLLKGHLVAKACCRCRVPISLSLNPGWTDLYLRWPTSFIHLGESLSVNADPSRRAGRPLSFWTARSWTVASLATVRENIDGSYGSVASDLGRVGPGRLYLSFNQVSCSSWPPEAEVAFPRFAWSLAAPRCMAAPADSILRVRICHRLFGSGPAKRLSPGWQRSAARPHVH